MNSQLAKLLSYTLHPAMYPLLGVIAILFFGPFYIPVQQISLIVLLIFVGTYILPFVLSYLLLRIGIIRSIKMETAKERRVPYLIGALCYYLVAMLVERLELPREAYVYLLSSTMVIVLHLVGLIYFKPSAHLAGIGGFTGLLLALSLKYSVNLLSIIATCFLLTGFLASARLYLKAHTAREVIAGYFSGLVIIGLMVYFA